MNDFYPKIPCKNCGKLREEHIVGWVRCPGQADDFRGHTIYSPERPTERRFALLSTTIKRDRLGVPNDGGSYEDLMDAICWYLSAGWTLHGPMITDQKDSEGDFVIRQAMVYMGVT